MHAVVGIWVSAFTLILLLSGLPWSQFWGDYFKQVRQLTGTAVARQEWSNSSGSPHAVVVANTPVMVEEAAANGPVHRSIWNHSIAWSLRSHRSTCRIRW